jgi:hypothetical protein
MLDQFSAALRSSTQQRTKLLANLDLWMFDHVTPSTALSVSHL